jgi:hypothetical protein
MLFGCLSWSLTEIIDKNGHETWFIYLRKECRLMVFENTQGTKEKMSFMILYTSPKHTAAIKSRTAGWAVHVARGIEEKCIQNFFQERQV